ncbi:MAG TPA: sulfotransferase [Allosphingosinicella sp.]|jgi:tetratricopeptide (TPR) repeat protein
MSNPPPEIAPALELAKQGRFPEALKSVEERLVQEPDSVVLLELASILTARLEDVPASTSYLRRLLAASPDNLPARLNLARALIATGAFEEAVGLCAARSDDLRLRRMLASALQELGRTDEAIATYRSVLATMPSDFESWNNLGNALAATGDLRGAATALERAIRIRPDVLQMYINASEILAKLDQPEARQRLLRDAAWRAPEDPQIWAELGLAENGARDFDAAARAFRHAISLSKGFTPAYLDLGLMLENLNRIDELAELVGQAEADGRDEPEIRFIKAWLLRRQGHLEEALELAEATPDTINPLRRAQLLAELYDRLGMADRAFPEFVEMNRLAVAQKPPTAARTYRQRVEAGAALLTADRIAAWSPLELNRTPPAPVFIVGFPRSGTTLLDTLLMNLPQLHVMEELPVLRAVEVALGDPGRLAGLSAEKAQALRALYFETVGKVSPGAADRTIVDKFPLHMAQMPLIHRLFPDAKVVLVERHPCDAVLSCFMSNFTLNEGMRSFTDLEEAARTYDAVFDSWSRATELLPIQVHRIRYEQMVEDLEREMRPLLDFLELPWDPQVLDNRRSAAKRDHIRTASYSQVTEPIYRRAAGRWERYRTHLEPVLPILKPWAEQMNYAL